METVQYGDGDGGGKNVAVQDLVPDVPKGIAWFQDKKKIRRRQFKNDMMRCRMKPLSLHLILSPLSCRIDTNQPSK
jgi:hypothetical protein